MDHLGSAQPDRPDRPETSTTTLLDAIGKVLGETFACLDSLEAALGIALNQEAEESSGNDPKGIAPSPRLVADLEHFHGRITTIRDKVSSLERRLVL